MKNRSNNLTEDLLSLSLIFIKTSKGLYKGLIETHENLIFRKYINSCSLLFIIEVAFNNLSCVLNLFFLLKVSPTDKANINPNEAPESVKSELSKISKRQDDIIRFIRHYEEEQLNPMIRTSNSIAVKFDTIVQKLCELVDSEISSSRELQDKVLRKVSEKFNEHTDVINSHAKQINFLSSTQQKGNTKLMKLISLYSELVSCGMMDSKRKENLKSEIMNLINEK
ncbi:MAG: BfmA/BtgA family mobilization protein [Dysgonomonas sp.]